MNAEAQISHTEDAQIRELSISLAGHDEIVERVAAMTPHDLQQIVDLSDVRFVYEHNFLGNWRVQVAAAIVEGVSDNQDWARELAA